MDFLSLVLGVLMLVTGVATFVRRQELAQRLAADYSEQEGYSPSWLPALLKKRFGLRETRIIALLLVLLLGSVGFWFIVAGLN